MELATGRSGFLQEFASSSAYYGSGFYFSDSATYVDSLFASRASHNEFGLPLNKRKASNALNDVAKEAAAVGRKPPELKCMVVRCC